MRKHTGTVILQQLGIGLLLYLWVLLVNFPVISFEMFYPEQASLYVANQRIVHLSDLLTIYAYPQLFDVVIPFFRPSGHFLMYQVLAPWLGWHNIQGFILVNLFFLTLTGFVIVRLYALLFPSYRIGGYIAFGYFLMHPALSLSRLIVLHFEFAYMFFSMAGLYYFVWFCQKNAMEQPAGYQSLRLHHYSALFFSFILMAIAVTFKEPAIMMGPVYFLYCFMTFSSFRFSKMFWQLLILIVVVTATLATYLILSWPHFQNPFHNGFNVAKTIAAISQFLKFIFALPFNVMARFAPDSPDMLWRPIEFPLITRLIIWFLFIVFLGMIGRSLLKKQPLGAMMRRSLVFLSVGALFFLILPIGWAMGLPWHLSLTIIFLGLIMGASVEYFLQLQKNKKWVFIQGTVIFLCIALTTIWVDQENINRYVENKDAYLSLLLNKNAVLSPPPIRHQLDDQSVLVIADSDNLGDYSLGNTADPFHYYRNYDERFVRLQQTVFLKADPYYNGTLFKYAYLMPNLKEEIFPFHVNQMKDVQVGVIYDWLSQGSHIFCFEYNEKGEWLDHTTAFKKALLVEQKRRHLVVHSYHHLLGTALGGVPIAHNSLTSPNVKACQYLCDQDARCKGFTFLKYINDPKRMIMECFFYGVLDPHKQKSCSLCEGYVKD